MRIFLLQHMLTDYFGHWSNETFGWVAAARSAGIELKVFAARDVNPEIARQTGARGVYAMTKDIAARYGIPSRFTQTPEPHCQHLIDFMAWSEAFRRACQATEAEGIGKDDLLAVPFASVNEMHGAALWLETLPAARRPALLFNFHEPHPAWRIEADRNRVQGDFSLSRYASRRMRGLVPEHRIIVTAPDRRLCVLMRQALELACHEAPMLMEYAEDAPAVRAAPAEAERGLTLSVMGDFRREKGSEQVLDAMRAFAAVRPDAGFFIQVRTEQEAIAMRDGLRREAPGLRLEVQIGPTPRETYLSQFRRSDLVLLAYRWQRYAIRTSGVFAEATAYGVPVVAPANTWMADQLEAGRGAGETFTEWTPASITAAMIRAAGRIGALKERAAGSAAAWRNAQSIHAYVPAVIDLWQRKS